MDDCFVLVRSEKIIDEFLNILNNAHDSINFTTENENNDELAFLDAQIKRKLKIFKFGVQKENFYMMSFKFSIKLQFKEKSKFNKNFVSSGTQNLFPRVATK